MREYPKGNPNSLKGPKELAETPNTFLIKVNEESFLLVCLFHIFTEPWGFQWVGVVWLCGGLVVYDIPRSNVSKWCKVRATRRER